VNAKVDRILQYLTVSSLGPTYRAVPTARKDLLDSLWKHGGPPHRYAAVPAYRYTVEPALVTEWNSSQQILLRFALTGEHLSRSIYVRIIVLINAALLECPSLSCGKQALVAMR
jgi:hypothetical protein